MLLSEKYFKNLVENSYPVMKNYVDDIILLCSSTIEFQLEQEKILHLMAVNKPVLLAGNDGKNYHPLSNEETSKFLTNLYSSGNTLCSVEKTHDFDVMQ
jgi:hypothetical protein